MTIHVREGSISGNQVSYDLMLDGAQRTLRFGVSEFPCSKSGDAALAATLLPAMKLGGELRVDGAVSAQLLTGVERVQRVHRIWRSDERIQAYPVFRGTKVIAHTRVDTPTTAACG